MTEFSFAFDQARAAKGISDSMCYEFWRDLGRLLDVLAEDLQHANRRVNTIVDGPYKARLEYEGRQVLVALDLGTLRLESLAYPNCYSPTWREPLSIKADHIQFKSSGPVRIKRTTMWDVASVQSTSGFNFSEGASLHNQVAEQLIAKLLFPNLELNAS
jgi:hypothetical protein